MQQFKVYIINLDKDMERMHFMHEQMQKLKIEYERVSAVYGKEYNFGDEYDSKLAIKLNGKDLTKGELGCAKSHKMCYEKILANKSKINLSTNENKNSETYTLILEDDVELPFNFKEIIENQIKVNNQKIKRGQNSWEYLLFDYPAPGKFFIHHWFNSIFLNYKNKKTDKDFTFYKKIKFTSYSILKVFYILPLAIFEYLRNEYYKNKIQNMDNVNKINTKHAFGKAVKFYRPLYLAGAYLLTDSAIKKIYLLTSPITYPADRTPDEAKKKLNMQFYAYTPLCVFQKRESFGSSILEIKKIPEKI